MKFLKLIVAVLVLALLSGVIKITLTPTATTTTVPAWVEMAQKAAKTILSPILLLLSLLHEMRRIIGLVIVVLVAAVWAWDYVSSRKKGKK